MESVFNKFKICLDIRDKIYNDLHNSQVKEINDVIKTMIGFNKDFNYNDVNGIVLYINKHFVFRQRQVFADGKFLKFTQHKIPIYDGDDIGLKNFQLEVLDLYLIKNQKSMDEGFIFDRIKNEDCHCMVLGNGFFNWKSMSLIKKLEIIEEPFPELKVKELIEFCKKNNIKYYNKTKKQLYTSLMSC
jgi:hypothetical protein